MTDESALEQRIAARVRQLRRQAGLSLEALALRSEVSRSMLSLIERGESSPTAVLLEKVATGLGVPLADLFQPTATAAASPVCRATEQTVWTDPASGYQRRNLTAPGWQHPLQLVEVRFPAGAHVAYETAARTPPVQQQVWLMAGQLHIRVGADLHPLMPGDCLAMRLDQPTTFHNPGASTAHYLVALATQAEERR